MANKLRCVHSFGGLTTATHIREIIIKTDKTRYRRALRRTWFVTICSNEICCTSDNADNVGRTRAKNFNIRTYEHMILGQLRMGARQAKNAPLVDTRSTSGVPLKILGMIVQTSYWEGRWDQN